VIPAEILDMDVGQVTENPENLQNPDNQDHHNNYVEDSLDL